MTELIAIDDSPNRLYTLWAARFPTDSRSIEIMDWGELRIDGMNIECLPRNRWPFRKVGQVKGLAGELIEKFAIGSHVFRRVARWREVWWDVEAMLD